MKRTYRRCGDYYLPNIGIPAEDMPPLGKYRENLGQKNIRMRQKCL